MKTFTALSAVLSAIAGIASAYTTPTTGPVGNPIGKPTLHEKVPVGKPYTITWSPTLHPEGTVTLLLVKGPSNNVIPQYPIVEKTPNSGTYVWTPDTSLPDSTEGYGIQLIVDSTGEYQWSTQFGFANDGVVVIETTTTTSEPAATTTTEAAEETTTEDYPTTTTTEESDYPTTTSTTEVETTTSAPANTTTTVEATTSTTTTEVEITTTEAETTTAEPSTFTTVVVTPTNSTVRPSNTSSPAPTVTDSGVSKNVASFGVAVLAVVVAGFAMF